MSRPQRRAMIDREEPKLSLVRQCALLGISRSSLYYLPTEAGAEDLELMALIDQQYLKTPSIRIQKDDCLASESTDTRSTASGSAG